MIDKPVVTPPALARLTDSTPAVLQICAWHADFNPSDPRNKGANHIICAECRARLEQEVA